MHEYAVIGHPRYKVIFFIALASIFISNFINNYIHQWLKLHLNIIYTYTFSSFTIFIILYVVFNKWLWKMSLFENAFNFPNLNGEWICKGLSNNVQLNKQFKWEGTVTIKQSWDKILISLKTKTSTSQSISVTGGIRYFAGVGYELSYHYENTPNASSSDLQKHEGFCILTFSENKKSAEGCYFNNIKERQSYGEMKLIKEGYNGKELFK